jgi:hypothetical protein
LRRASAHATTCVVTVATVINTAPDGGEASSAWQELRAEGNIQFAPVDVPPASAEMPEWLRQLGEFLSQLFEPVALALAYSWPVLKWVLLALAVAALLYIIYRIVEPYLRPRSGSAEYEDDDGWRPDQQIALALLEEADRLAAEGKYDAATHLLLQRSVAQIAEAKPGLVEPSSTARELAVLPVLPAKAQQAFAIIAHSVERSLFALRALNQTDWEEARAAYANFALERIDGRILDRTASRQPRLRGAAT